MNPLTNYGPSPISAEKRLLARRTVCETGCWEWIGGTNGVGYGMIRVGSMVDGTRARVLTHRLAYQLWRGQIPKGLVLDHLCRNRICFNPHHLEAVTMAENLYRGQSPTAVNKRSTHCVLGHPLSGENLIKRKGTKSRPNGARRCRTCFEKKNENK